MQLSQEVKQTAHKLIDNLPDDATWEKVLYTLQVRHDIEAGLADVEAGRVLTSDEVREQLGLKKS